MSDVPQIFDKVQGGRQLLRALRGVPALFLLERAAEDLGERMSPVLRDFSSVLDFGTPGPQAAAVLRQRKGAGLVSRYIEHDCLREGNSDQSGSLELPMLDPSHYDCVVSLLALQTINDLPGVLMQMRRSLKPDGLFIAAMIGGETLKELRAALLDAEVELTGGASPRVAPFADVRSLGQLLQRAGFALPVADSEVLNVRYASPIRLMHDLRAMGATNSLVMRSRKPLRRDVLFRALELYTERYADPDGKVRATFEIIWLTGWTPHESQQKPLKPGSAKTRLSDALKAVEQSAGEKVRDE